MLKKTAIAMLLIGGTVLGGAASASAGEWNPAQGYTHGEDHSGAHPGKSICAYSGLDDPDADPPFLGATAAKGRVQSPGQFVTVFGPGAAGIPGEECRGR